jgi:hypothetical protein
MLATLKHNNVVCYQLRSNLYDQLDHPLQKELDKLSKEIIQVLSSSEKIEHVPTALLVSLFNFRVKALKWLVQDSNFNFLEMMTDVSDQIIEIRGNKKIEILKENILFALRCNERVVLSLLEEKDLQNNVPTDDFNKMPDINYQQLLTSITLLAHSDESAQLFVDFTNASLAIEFVLISAAIIDEENVIISDKKIGELSFLISDVAQEYMALATEIGILKTRSGSEKKPTQTISKAAVKSQKDLAELGFEDFAANFTNE